MKAQILKIAGVNSEAEFYKKYPTEEAFFAAHPEAQMMRQGGEMIKRADGSYSKRGLWDNIRANKGSGKKPTKEMLEQERKIRAEEKAYGGEAGYHMMPDGSMMSDSEHPMMRNGGYTVTRSHDRKGKTHKVTGPDGTVKYFGDSKLGQHPNDPARKKAFYARHKHNLDHNPYFRAFARATWQEGGDTNDMQSSLSRMNMTPSVPTMDQLQAIAGFIPGLETAMDLKDIALGAVTGDYAQMQRGKLGLTLPVSGKTLMAGMDMASPGLGKKIDEVANMSKADHVKLFKRYGYGGYDQWVKEGRPKLKKGGSTYSGGVWFQDGGDPDLKRAAEAIGTGVNAGFSVLDKSLAYGLKGAKWIGKNVFGKDDIVPDAVKNYIFDSIRPVSYPNNLIQVASEFIRSDKAKPTKDKSGDLRMDEEAWSRVLGRPTKSKYFVPSQYRPGSETDPNAQYYQLAPGIIDEERMKRILNDNYFARNAKKNKRGQEYVPLQGMEPLLRQQFLKNYKQNPKEDFYETDPLANFQVYRGKDPKTGKPYLSISDTYDFGLESANEMIKPMNIYHRIYGKGGSTYSGNVWFQDGGEGDDTSWIKKILNYEYQHGSPTGSGLSDYGYHTRKPKSLDEAVGYFKQDYLPKVQNLPMGMRERAADFLYNTGEDARLYQLDQYARKYENMPNGIPDRGLYRAKGSKAGEFDNLYGQYQAKIDALPMEERIGLMDAGRDYYYKNINNVNGQPSAAYNATWKPRVNMWGAYAAPQPQVQATQAAAAPQVQRAIEQVNSAPSLQVKQQPVNGFALPNLTALPSMPTIGPAGAQAAVNNTGVLNQNQNTSGLNSPLKIDAKPLGAIPAVKQQVKTSGNPFYPVVTQDDTSLASLYEQIPGGQPVEQQPAAAAVIGQQVQDSVAKANPALNLGASFNDKLSAVQNKLAQGMNGDPTVGAIGDIIEGINNEKDYNAALDKQKRNYSTDYAYNTTYTNQSNKGQYDMYGTMMPNQIGGNLSFAGMNQKYSVGNPRFAEGGISDFDYIADIANPVVSNDPLAGLRNNFSVVAPADATRVAAPMSMGPINSSPDTEDIANIIGSKESHNQYGALPKDKHGRLASSAVGKYQFLWNDHKDQIKAITGISSKEAFRTNPQAQEKFFEYWNNNILTPVANEIKSRFQPNMSMNDIKQIIHFQGPAGAKKYFSTGKFTTDNFGSTPLSYLQKKYQQGGEIEVTEDELAQILKMGGQVEYC